MSCITTINTEYNLATFNDVCASCLCASFLRMLKIIIHSNHSTNLKHVLSCQSIGKWEVCFKKRIKLSKFISESNCACHAFSSYQKLPTLTFDNSPNSVLFLFTNDQEFLLLNSLLFYAVPSAGKVKKMTNTLLLAHTS